MPVIHARISHKKVRTGAAVVRSMERLLAKRFKREIDRKTFLRRWTKQRNDLRLTKEYRAFCAEVRTRARGLCELCSRMGHVVHHKREVAYAPHLAFEPDNGELRCRGCHVKAHPWMKKANDDES